MEAAYLRAVPSLDGSRHSQLGPCELSVHKYTYRRVPVPSVQCAWAFSYIEGILSTKSNPTNAPNAQRAAFGFVVYHTMVYW